MSPQHRRPVSSLAPAAPRNQFLLSPDLVLRSLFPRCAAHANPPWGGGRGESPTLRTLSSLSRPVCSQRSPLTFSAASQPPPGPGHEQSAIHSGVQQSPWTQGYSQAVQADSGCRRQRVFHTHGKCSPRGSHAHPYRHGQKHRPLPGTAPRSEATAGTPAHELRLPREPPAQHPGLSSRCAVGQSRESSHRSQAEGSVDLRDQNPQGQLCQPQMGVTARTLASSLLMGLGGPRVLPPLCRAALNMHWSTGFSCWPHRTRSLPPASGNPSSDG